MDRELSHLTNMQIKALDILSMDYGITNQELTCWLDQKKGNVSEKSVGPLLKAGLVYQVKMKNEYPKKRLYINKSFENIRWLKNELANPVSGKIKKYQDAHNKEQAEYKKNDFAFGGNTGDLPISDEHAKIRGILSHCIHLYKWCDKIGDEMRAMLLKEKARPYFSLLPSIPSDALEQIKTDEYHQEHLHIVNTKWEFEPLR